MQLFKARHPLLLFAGGVGIALSSCSGEPERSEASNEVALSEERGTPEKQETRKQDPKELEPDKGADTLGADPEPEKATDPRTPSKGTAQSSANAGDVADFSSALDAAPDPKTGAVIEDIWKPASTPKGGVSWKTLESTGETTRLDSEGYIISKPQFTAAVKRLEGKRIKVAGWMMPIENTAKQKHFILLGYPPGCPYHFHAAPMQFIEVFADTAFPTNETMVHTVSGVLELTGYDESGIFYRLRKAKPS